MRPDYKALYEAELKKNARLRKDNEFLMEDIRKSEMEKEGMTRRLNIHRFELAGIIENELILN
jgi:hypothetical protein